MESSQFTDNQSSFESLEPLDAQGATCDTFRVKLYGKLHFLKRLKSEFANDIRYQEAFRKEFETGYRLEHPNLVRYITLTEDGILMEYIDGETLTQCLANHPDYFEDKKNTDKFLHQLLDAVSYLHSHQVLHLDLKPDNILLTRINNDVKLVDLGGCYTDTFTDTQGRTNRFASPEQLAGEATVDARSDIFAIGKILELLPTSNIYNKVIARCTAPDKAARYQSVEEIIKVISNQRKPYRKAIAAVLAFSLIVSLILWNRHDEVAPVIEQKAQDTSAVMLPDTPQAPTSLVNQGDKSRDSVHQDYGPVPLVPPESPPQPSTSVTMDVTEQTELMEKELDRLLDSAYRSTIITFCDSVFPSLTVGRQWEKESSEFHVQALQAAADLSRKYPDIPESVIMQYVESRFYALTGYVFNKMRKNGEDQSKRSSE